jgi:hypothetical protein
MESTHILSEIFWNFIQFLLNLRVLMEKKTLEDLSNEANELASGINKNSTPSEIEQASEKIERIITEMAKILADETNLTEE